MNERSAAIHKNGFISRTCVMVKWYYETHSLNLLTMVLYSHSNSVTLSYHAIHNLIEKIENEHTLDDLPRLGTTVGDNLREEE